MTPSRTAGRDRVRAPAMLLALLALLAGHGGLAWITREPGVLTGQDDAEYIVLARSLQDGGYNDLFRVDAPPHRTYPPVYPAALAAWSAVFGSDFDTLVALNVVISVATLALFFVVLRQVAGGTLALVATGLLAINPALIEYAGGIRSEPLFTLLALLALAALLRSDGADRRGGGGPGQSDVPDGSAIVTGGSAGTGQAGWIVAAVAFVLLATLTRSIGVTLIGAVALHWLIQKRWLLVGIPVAFAGGAAAMWLAWSSRGSEQFVGASYVAELQAVWTGTPWTGALPGRALRWTEAYLRHGLPWGLGFPAIPGTPIDNLLLIGGMGLLGAVGLIFLFRRWRPAAIWIIVYAAFLILWIFYVDRFVLPVVPLLLACILIGARTAGRRRGGRAARALPATVVAILAVGGAIHTAGLVRSRAGCDRSGDYPDAACMSVDQRAYFDALRWIDANTPADAAFLTAKAGALYLYTGRRSVGYESSLREPTDHFIDHVRDLGADWIVLADLYNPERNLLAPLLRSNCHRLRLEAAFPPRTWVFRTLPAEDEDSTACEAVESYLAAPHDEPDRFSS